MPDDSVWLCCRSCGKGKLYCKLSFGIEAYISTTGLPTKHHAELVAFTNKHLQCGIDDEGAGKQSIPGAKVSLVAYQFNRNIGLHTEDALEWIGDDPDGGSACRLKKEAMVSSGDVLAKCPDCNVPLKTIDTPTLDCPKCGKKYSADAEDWKR